MSQNLTFLRVTLLTLTFLTTASADIPNGQSLYRQTCAGCHGINLEGGQAQSLIDAVWQFGSKRSHIFRNVKYGIADFAMPAFEGGLSDKQINDILDYVFEAETKSGAQKPGLPSKAFSLDYELEIETVLETLDIPWGLAFPSDDEILITERGGTLSLFNENTEVLMPIRGLPEVVAEGQGGLLDVAVGPEGSEDKWVYLAYSHALESQGQQRAPAMTKIIRGKVVNGEWQQQQDIYKAPESLYLETRHHYGSRIVFDRDGYLYFGIGDRGLSHHAQDLGRPNGKIHRIHADGSIPKDNPYTSNPNALPSIFCLGHRNPQGLAVHPSTGRLWESEHGPMGGDELNVIDPSANYGWPVVTYGRNYNGNIISERVSHLGMQQPKLYWKPSIAVCGIDFVKGNLFPRWKDGLLVGALKYEELRLLTISAESVIHQEILLKNAGRVRDVSCRNSGEIYLALNGPDAIIRLTPGRDLNLGSD